MFNRLPEVYRKLRRLGSSVTETSGDTPGERKGAP